MPAPLDCPVCRADLRDSPIPPQQREMFGNASHFSKAIGLSNGDSIRGYRCPDCLAVFQGVVPRNQAEGFRTNPVEVTR